MVRERAAANQPQTVVGAASFSGSGHTRRTNGLRSSNLQFPGWNRPTEYVSLNLCATLRLQILQLRARFDTLGVRSSFKPRAIADDCIDDAGVVPWSARISPTKLRSIFNVFGRSSDRKARNNQCRSRRSRFVRPPCAARATSERSLHVLHDRVFGNFDLDPICGQSRGIEICEEAFEKPSCSSCCDVCLPTIAAHVTVTGPAPLATSVNACIWTHSSNWMMRPVSSATDKKSSGSIRPRRGCCQRTSASTPMMRPSAKSTCGW